MTDRIANFESFYRRTAPAYYRRAVLELGSVGEARRCLQQAYENLWQENPYPESESRLKTLLDRELRTALRAMPIRMRIATRCALDHKSPIEGSGWSTLDRVRRFVGATLPPKMGHVVKTVFFGHRTTSEAADALGMNPVEVRSRMVDALCRLRNQIIIP